MARNEAAQFNSALADNVINGNIERTAQDLAVRLSEMSAEVIRLNEVIRRIVLIYTKIDPPLAEYLAETGDLP